MRTGKAIKRLESEGYGPVPLYMAGCDSSVGSVRAAEYFLGNVNTLFIKDVLGICPFTSPELE